MGELIKIRSRRRKTLIGLFVVFFILVFGAYALRRVGDNRGYAPTQPIPFSHKLHAGDFRIDCQYCHSGVSKSRVASVPGMNVCLNCHSIVKADSPPIQKIKALAEKGDSLEWVRVHDLPDYVFFNHQRHVAKGVACETCHGDVKKRVKVRQVQRFNMGFCVNCHRQENEKDKTTQASLDCNACHN